MQKQKDSDRSERLNRSACKQNWPKIFLRLIILNSSINGVFLRVTLRLEITCCCCLFSVLDAFFAKVVINVYLYCLDLEQNVNI